MTAEFKTLVQLSQEGAFDQLMESAKSLVDLPINPIGSSTISDQAVIGAVAAIIVGIIFLPFGATQASIKACQLNTDQKLLKIGGVLIVIMTSLSAILYLEVLKLSGMIGNI